MHLHGVPIYMNDLVDACVVGRLNLFLQGDTGSGKTQLATDVMSDFRDKSLFILGRNDMDTRDLFQRFNLHKLGSKPKYGLEPLVNPDTGKVDYYYPTFEKGIFAYQKVNKEQAGKIKSKLEELAGSSEDIKELTSKINTNLLVVDELPNCVPAVRAQLFNIFDGFMEISGKAYAIGGRLIVTHPDGRTEVLSDGYSTEKIEAMRNSGSDIWSSNYSMGIATGNIGREFTESSNELGRALKDRMHVTVDADYFHPDSGDTLEILSENTDPRVNFTESSEDRSEEKIKEYKELSSQPIPFEKIIIANYLMHGLDYCSKGSKRKMKEAWPTELEDHEQGSDVGLVRPVSIRGAKSIIRLSQALDDIARKKGASKESIRGNYLDSMMQAYKFVSAYSGVLDEARVGRTYGGDRYNALDAVITTTKTQFDQNTQNIQAGLRMVKLGKRKREVLDLFKGRWGFMKDTLDRLAQM